MGVEKSQKMSFWLFSFSCPVYNSMERKIKSLFSALC